MSHQPAINALPYGKKEPGFTVTYRNPKSFNDFQYFPISQDGRQLKTLQDCFLETVRQHGSKQFLGQRNPEKNNLYEFKTYNEVFQIAEYIGSGIVNLKLSNYAEDKQSGPMNVIGIVSKNRLEWSFVDVACALYNLTLVPFYDTSDPETQTYVIKLAGLQTVFATKEVLEFNFKRLTDFGPLKQIVTFDKLSWEIIHHYSRFNIKIITLEDVISAGKQHICPFVKSTPQTPFSFCFTSGTTGNPKGALLLNKNILSYIASVPLQDTRVTSDDVHLSYLPLAHVFERGVWWGMAFRGCTICFSSGDVANLQQDLTDVRPTIFITVARILNKWYDNINNDIKNFETKKREEALKAVQIKLQNFKKNAVYTHQQYDKQFFNELKTKYTGGRLRWVCTGAAPVSFDIMEFLKITFSCPILEGYGQTENCGLNFHSLANDNLSGHTGGPFSNTEYRLMDLPHMGYTTNDKDDNGNPIERGEILMRGPCVFGGYFKNPKKTAEAIDKDGWLHTNDVGQIMKNGGLKIIDRVNNIFKMAQGEYIAPDKVQNTYSQCQYVQECFIYGDSLREYLVGIIVPSENMIKKTAASLNIQGDFQTLCKSKKLVDMVLKNMREVGREKGLKGYEQVRKIHLEPISMITLGILTPSLKLKRKEAKAHFQTIIDNLYASQQSKL